MVGVVRWSGQAGQDGQDGWLAWMICTQHVLHGLNHQIIERKSSHICDVWTNGQT